MADITKYAPIGVGGGNLISDLKSHFSLFRTKRTVAIAYGFVFIFIAFTIFLAFSPTPNSSSPWFTSIFSATSSDGSSSSSSSIFSDDSYRSHFSSFFSYFYAHSSSPTDNVRSQNLTIEPSNLNIESPVLQNQTQNKEKIDTVEVLKPSNISVLPPTNRSTDNRTPPKSSSESNKGSSNFKNQVQIEDLHDKVKDLKQNQIRNKDSDGKVGVLKQNQTQTEELHDKVEVSKTNQSTIGVTKSPVPAKQAVTISPNSASGNEDKGIAEKGLIKNLTSSNKHDDLIKSLKNCDFFDGNWVRDNSYPLYNPGSCSLIDEQFNCFLNGRPDSDYHRMKWKPKGCTLPRLNGSHMLEMLRGKRLVFVGDSLNRNMWESLLCILRNSVKDQSKVYEQQGRHHFRTEASYSFIFEDYKCTVEFFVTPFLVQEWETEDKNGTKKETLRLDIVERSADHYKNADILVFNTGHWWTHEKTSKGEDYYQEGSHVYKELNVLEAFRKALTTWGRWVDVHVNPKKTLVFFRGYSASHFSGGQWNSGGQCDHESEPIKNETYLTPYPEKMTVLENVLKGMKTQVTYLNVTKMTDYRKDGHPSMYRKQFLSDEERKSPLSFQDCSHWCLPGVPDAWNEIMYAELLVNQKQHKKMH
ncbi:Protein trichome birefringence [Abeliophyllum distichum]|uniref:Protein trichome birefringence n=1 Tax=Abeliophyllum distichum TaxID=126358 RepID=A0ABD1QWB9_9LAMI